ncbi:hypothetical protein E3U47_23535 [Pseudomonas sp. RIT623]|nr:hypothetical protein E3U47_23535 [Pseudomonas sp. RIT623]
MPPLPIRETASSCTRRGKGVNGFVVIIFRHYILSDNPARSVRPGRYHRVPGSPGARAGASGRPPAPAVTGAPAVCVASG